MSADPTQQSSAPSTAILVLGMHRSGTSALARILNLLGAELGSDLLPPAADNTQGFWEHRQINDIQARILDRLNQPEIDPADSNCRDDSGWRIPTPLPAHWQNSPEVRMASEKIESVLRSDFAASPLWAIKDPRTSLLLPLWRQILSRMNCRGVCILTVRNPLEVVRSLEKRDRLSRACIYMLWLRYMLDAELHSRTWPRAIVQYRSILTDWSAEIEKITRRFDIHWPIALSDAAGSIEKFLDASLRHHNVSDERTLEDASVPEIVRHAYAILLKCSDHSDPHFHAQLDSVRARLDQPDALLGQYIQALQTELRHIELVARSTDSRRAEAEARSAEKIRSLEAEANRQFAAAMEQIQNLRSWREQLAETIANLQAGLAASRQKLAESEQRTDQQRAKTKNAWQRLEEIRADMVDLRKRERDASALAHQRGEQLALRDNTIQTLQEHLAAARVQISNAVTESQAAQRRADYHRLSESALHQVVGRTRASLPWRLGVAARAMRQWLQPLQLTAAHFIASPDLQPRGPGKWQAAGDDPQFVLPCPMPLQWVQLDICFTTSTPSRCEMFFDTGAGFNIDQRLDFGELFGKVNISLLYRLPTGVQCIRWDPMSQPGILEVERFEIKTVPSLVARLRRGRKHTLQIFSAPASEPGHFASDPIAAPSPGAVEEVRGKGNLEHRTQKLELKPSRDAKIDKPQPAPLGVNYFSPMYVPTGLGMAGRGYRKAIAAAGLPLIARDVPSWTGREKRDDRPFENELLRWESLPGYAINIIHQNPDMLPFFLGEFDARVMANRYNIGIWVWELQAFRPDWHSYFRNFHEIWAPTEFVRRSIASVSPIPVVRVPHVVDRLEDQAVFGREHFDLPAEAFIFIYSFDVSSYMERKNPFALIDAFKKVFGQRKDVLLLLKYHSTGYNIPLVRALRRAAEAPNIRTLTGVLSEEEAHSLHQIADCLVSPHRAEGFGLNIAESMYFGKAVVATNYSGPADWMTAENSYPVDYNLIEIEENAGPYFAGYVWADPQFEDLCAKMKLAFEDEGERKRRGEAAQRIIREKFSVATVSEIIRGRLEGAVAEPRRSLQRAIVASPRERRAIACDCLPHQPTISIITPVFDVPGEYLEKCIRSVIKQSYPNWELCLCDDKSTSDGTLAVLERYQGVDPRIKIVHSAENRGIAPASNLAAEFATGEFVAMLDNDDELHPDALHWIARAVNENPSADMLYTDEDKIEIDGTHTESYYKPDWSPEHLRSVMYLLHLLVVRKSVFLKVGMFRAEYSGAQDYDLALRVSEVSENIVHVPRVLYHWRKIPGSAASEVEAKPYALDAGRRALANHIGRIDPEGQVDAGALPGTFRYRSGLRNQPRVTLAILASGRTADVPNRGTIDLALHFVRSIVEKTTYKNYEILIVDDDNLTDQQTEELNALSCRRVTLRRERGMPFNFARKANFAIEHILTNHLVLLNDDMEVIAPDWLTALLEFSTHRDIGAVGGKLITTTGRLQHAGVVLGVNGGAAHVFHNAPADMVGYNAFTHVIRNFSAVTGACLATRKEIIREVGGFDERFAIDYNDTAFCLAVRKLGYRIVYTPFCQLYHFESTSILRTAQNPQEVELFRRLWGEMLANDPYYNPNLSRSRHDYGC